MDKAILSKFSKRVRKLRNERGLTQQQLAELAGIEYKYIQRIEGKDPPSLGLVKMMKLADAFGVSASELLKNI